MTILWCVPKEEEIFPWRKGVIGSIFCGICAAGGSAALYPRYCTAIIRGGITRLDSSSLGYEGHHPTCGRFSSHVIRFRGRTFCASCTGLTFGALLSILGMSLYISDILIIDSWSQLYILAGMSCMAIGLYHVRFGGVVRSTLNTLLVIGAFLYLVGVDSTSRSLVIGMFVEAFIVLLILGRLMLSELDHLKICRGCNLLCELKLQR